MTSIARSIQPVPPLRMQTLDGPTSFGTYAGVLHSTNMNAVVKRARCNVITRTLREKRWQWFGVLDAQLAVGGAIIKSGYIAHMFLWVFDRQQQRMLLKLDRSMARHHAHVSDQPASGDLATCLLQGARLEMTQHDGYVHIFCDFAHVSLDLVLHTHQGSPATAVCSTPKGGVNVTQKNAGIKAQGIVRVHNQEWTLDAHAQGLLDYTHGLMARKTSWRWAMGGGVDRAGIPIGFNLVSGFNQGLENVLWHDHELYTLPKVTFEYAPNDMQHPWFVKSKDGSVALKLDIEGMRSAHLNMKLIESRYVQPIGTWTGHIQDHIIERVAGVAEDHHAVW